MSETVDTKDEGIGAKGLLGIIVTAAGFIAAVIAIVQFLQPEPEVEIPTAAVWIENQFEEESELNDQARFAAEVLDHSWRASGEPFFLFIGAGDIRSGTNSGLDGGYSGYLASAESELFSIREEHVSLAVADECFIGASCSVIEFGIYIPRHEFLDSSGVSSDHPMLSSRVLNGLSDTAPVDPNETRPEYLYFHIANPDSSLIRVRSDDGLFFFGAFVVAEYIEGAAGGIQRWRLRVQELDPKLFSAAFDEAFTKATKNYTTDKNLRIMKMAESI